MPANKQTNENNELVLELRREGFDKSQRKQLIKGIEEGLDITPYKNWKYSSEQMKEIRKGLERQLDTSIYAKPCFNDIQMYHIRKGLEKGLDVSQYADAKFDKYQMYEIHKGLLHNVDISKYANEKVSDEIMEYIRINLERGIDIVQYITPQFSLEQFSLAQLEEICIGIIDNVDVSHYRNPKNTSSKMKTLRQLQYLEEELKTQKHWWERFKTHCLIHKKKKILEYLDNKQTRNHRNEQKNRSNTNKT